MIAFCVNSRYSYGDVVAWKGKRWVVIASRAYQSQHYRPEANTISLCLLPEESVGMETDDQIWIGECNLK